MRRGQKKSRRDLANILRPEGGYIWIHAASLGEFEQGRPLIERLHDEHPGRPILLTFFSPSGYEVRKDYTGVDAVAYLPFDTPRNARRFLDAVKPSMAIFIKYEFWGNYLEQLKKRGVSTYIISAIFRPRQVFFKPWGGLFRKMLKCFDTLYLQDSESKRLLSEIGITNTVVAGDTRFDRVTDVMNHTFDMPEVERFLSVGKMRLIAGSSWEADEDLYIPYINNHPEIKVAIAPHEMKGDRVDRLMSRCQNGAVRLSELKENHDVQVLVIDSFGKLSSLYRYGDVAYVGGGFGAGIHNINEAAVYGMPVIFGPKFDKFKEARDMISLNCAFSVNSDAELSGLLDKMLNDNCFTAKAGEIAGKYIKDNLGATDRIYSDLFG